MTLRLFHLNAGTMSPPSALLVNGRGGLFERARMVCHILLIERAGELCLVDTGIGLNDINNRDQLPAAFLKKGRPSLDPAETAIAQVGALGFDPHNVRHVVMTHLDRDHAGGLADFPWAKVHVHDTEHRAAVKGQPAVQPGRYAAQQWRHGPDWATYDRFGADWMGLPSCQVDLFDGWDVRLVPLPGHTPGHSGVAVKRGDDAWFFHAGDAYYSRRQIDSPPRRAPLGLLFQIRKAEIDRAQRIASEDAVRRLRQRPAISICCTHDPDEFDRLSK
ncbi:MAG: MBL fold metallo-hydrolase [Bradyrhizobium sp.]|uniref:MBL fold metallo-hydrolase n=1 Tax=Bradyrhizobium sp. TaxID=376 RepID=UPI001DF343B4|nr:MBL fold metallo-hydrolase [Bradyrhizobium sp.]MBV9560948.1 MBL fold metallo-hydrolase [Bradyrhizobium sp.]